MTPSLKLYARPSLFGVGLISFHPNEKFEKFCYTIYKSSLRCIVCLFANLSVQMVTNVVTEQGPLGPSRLETSENLRNDLLKFNHLYYLR